MLNNKSNAAFKAGIAAALLLGSGAAMAQQTVNLIAAPTTANMADGSAVPMWGYSCAGVSGTALTTGAQTCAALNPAANTATPNTTSTTIWSPVVITVPYVSGGTTLTISLANSLQFSNSNSVPTSLTIVGQVGGGLGSTPTRTPSPAHAQQGVTWSTVTTPGTGAPGTGGAPTVSTFTPPPQPDRVQSFGTEVAAGAVTTLTWNNLRPGTYLIESGTHPSIQGPMGLYGVLVVTTAPVATTAPGTAYAGVTYDADVALLFSEIDPLQNSAVSTAVNTAGFKETNVWSGQPNQCGNPSAPAGVLNTCYPPAVNYTPLYYLINGVGFDRTHASSSLFATAAIAAPPLTGTPTGTVLVRLVNAGVRMHVPSIVGSLTNGVNGAGAAVVTPGFALIAEDGNPLPPGAPRVQSDVFMAAGKTFDVMINGPASGSTAPALAVFDRQLSLSGNAIERDAGMLAYIGINGAAIPTGVPSVGAAAAMNDMYNSVVPGQTLNVSLLNKGVLANDVNVFGVKVVVGGVAQTGPVALTNGTVTLNANGTFTYVANAGTSSDSFMYCGNGTTSGAACATVTLGPATMEASSGITCTGPISYTSTTATYIAVKTPGVLATCKDGAGYSLTVDPTTIVATGATVVADANGGFTATTTGAGTPSFTFRAKNSQGTLSAPMTVNLTFPAGSGLTVTVLDGYDKTTTVSDYRWVIEEDRTFYIDPKCVQNPPPAGCPTMSSGIVPTLGVNFHTSYMPYVAQGCTGPTSCEGGQTVLGVPAACDVGNGVCRTTDGSGNPVTQFTQVNPNQVALDPTKRYYISVLPGDSADPFTAAYTGVPCGQPGSDPATCSIGHGMGGAPIAAGQTSVTVLTQPSPYPPANLSVFVFEDDFPLNGEQDGGGGVDVLSPQEPGLGNFQIHLWDAFGGNGDFTGQMTYDMFNQPLTNGLDGTTDPLTGLNACPITAMGLNSDGTSTGAGGITGMIVTCPKYEGDNKTLSPLAGQAVIKNLMPGRWGVIATPGADRIARGEEWLQTNTLDGQKAHDSFTRIGEPNYFQEFGPAGFHVSVGFANPAIINARKPFVCNGTDASSPSPGTALNCTNTIKGRVTGQRLSRTPDERLYESGSHDTYAWTQCYVSFGDADAEDFAFTKCDADGNFTLTGLPDGDWRITTFDQWNDQLVDGLSTPVRLGSTANAKCPGSQSNSSTCDMGDIAATQWQTNLYTRTFVDDNKNGLSESNETGIPFANVAVRLRDGSLENLLTTDFTGATSFNETFPLFAWYTVETDVTRYKNTGTHVVYDVGGPADGTSACGQAGYPPCGNSKIGKYLANTAELISVPTNLRVPGAVYCKDADCSGKSIQNGPAGDGTIPNDPPSACTANTSSTGSNPTCTTLLSSGRIDPPWVGVEGWQGFPGQNNFIEFGKTPYAPGENGGIKGHVVYASTRPFDDPQMLVQTQWEPLVPHVTINLYQEGLDTDGVTPTLKLVDTTKTSSWDDWAQGFRSDSVPNMNCPGQGASSGAQADLFFFSIYNQPQYLDFYNSQHGGSAPTPLPYNSQFKCYDGMHNWNQIQPAPYDGMYQFPSVTALDPKSGKPTSSNCTGCITNPDASDPYRFGTPMLPPGKYVVEVVLPPGFELVKEEDKNILIGDNYIAPVTQQFGGLGNVFIIPDQASVASAYTSSGVGYNANNAQNPTQGFGTSPSNNIVPSFVPEPTWPCVGEARIVPDYISLYPQTHQVAPFAGATRNLCDRKEVTLDEQAGAIAKFFIYTSTHIAAKFTGGITDDYTSEFDPFSPQFGEKFAPPDLPVSVKDWAGNETNRVYADHWGAYNGMTYSTWEVNPPNPTGYAPTMMVVCMNDPGPIAGPGGTMITDPLFTKGYSQFCYELPFMPGTTQYLDTPVVPTSAFAGAGYNNVDCAYPDTTPAVSEVDGDGVGPWVGKSGNTLTITALGDQQVPNNAYSGPSATAPPYNQKTVKRHYGFGSQCTTPSAGNASCNTASKVTIGGVTASITSWIDTQIKVTVPGGVPNCAIQQQSQYQPAGTPSAQCGELVITAGNGKQSIDTITVTIGGKAPTHVAASASIQTAIDAAAPGDLIVIDPTCNAATGAVSCQQPAVGGATITGTTVSAHNELLLMWKPVRLQGVGAASSIINANTHPAGKLDPWRRAINCLFGLSINGQPATTGNPYDPSSSYTCPYGTGANGGVGPNGNTWNYFVGTAGAVSEPQVDRIPFEAVVGWDATQNGNLAEQLQEPSLMGALEGAGITVLAKGLRFPAGQDPFGGVGAAGAFPTGTTLLTGNLSSSGNLAVGDSNALCHKRTGRINPDPTNPNPSNFVCNPSSIDGLTVTDSSQGGGAIYVHAWGHYLQIANNRIQNNAGTLSGGINLGQGEFPPSYIAGSAVVVAPGSCLSSAPTNVQLPYCHNVEVNVHHNDVSLNSSIGDELFSATPAGAGGVSICTGADYYKFNYNWVCGNLSSGDGGGFGHLGFSYNGDIENNTFIFNQSTNPTIPANGGGLIIMGSPDADPTCGATVDTDCVPTPGSVTPSDGVGPNLVINANLIMGNAAESGTGGGIAFQNVNGSEVVAFPTSPNRWYSPRVTNNIIVNNVAGWDGAGISLHDALNINIVNNTIASNSSTASAGPLFNTIGAPSASNPAPAGSVAQCGSSTCTTSPPQVAGLVSLQNSAVLKANLPATVMCPANHYAGSTATNGTCRTYSYPLLFNDALWQNTSYYIGVGPLSPQFQQNVISLYNAFTGTAAANQTGTGQCVAGANAPSYWDIGVRGDTGPTNHATVKLSPQYSVLTNSSDYTTTSTGAASHNNSTNPGFITQYCDGSRQPPEFGASGWAVPAGISDATVPNPVFNLTPAATVDEGNNWVNMRWGPLSTTNPTAQGADGNYGGGAPLGNYGLAAASGGAYNMGLGSIGGVNAPPADFFGTTRPQAGVFDVGAVELVVPPAPVANVTGGPLNFGNVLVNSTSTSRTLTLHNTGNAPLTGIAVTVTAPFARLGGTCTDTLTNNVAQNATCTITVTFSPTTTGPAAGTVTITAGVPVTGSPVGLSGTGVPQVVSGALTPGTWSVAATRGCSGFACPFRFFMLTNNGNVPLTGITQAVLGGANASEFTVNRMLSTCGPAVGGQLLGQTTLAPGTSCMVTVSFSPLTTQTTGAKTATLSVTDAAGTQTSNLNGTAR